MALYDNLIIFLLSKIFQVSLEEQQQQHLRCESDTEADFLDRNEESSSFKKPENINKQNMLTHAVTTNGDKDIYASLQRSSDKKEDKNNSSSQLPNNNNNSSGENSVQVMKINFFSSMSLNES
jgi:hypothetical protein